MSAVLKVAAPLPLIALALIHPAFAAAPASVSDVPTVVNPTAIAMFFLFVLSTLAITAWAARRSRSRQQFYAAGGGITPWQNGLAIAGDFCSAASFLGISGQIFSAGFDGVIYAAGFLMGWPILLCLIAESLRNLGRYSFVDVVSFRLQAMPVRTVSAIASLTTVLLYLTAQMVGAGKLIELLFGLSYTSAVVLVGVLMVIYVTLGGMLATTWVQIIKAVLLLSGTFIMVILVLSRFGFNPEHMFAAAASLHPAGIKIMAPGGAVSDPVSAVSLGIALIFGTAGLPHILMRFFTVRNAQAARRSVMVATGLISGFYLMTIIIGFGAVALLYTDPTLFNAKHALLGGANMAAVQLAGITGGPVFLGFISAVAFATILAVVAGLALAGATAVSHDLYTNVWRHGHSTERNEIMVSRLATLVIGLLSMGMGIAFEQQNVAFMVGMAFAVAASANFPVLLLALKWSRFTTRGAVAAGVVGLVSAVTLMVLGPAVWVKTLGYATAIFPYEYPAIFSVPLAFLAGWLASITDRSAFAAKERAAFPAQDAQGQIGLAEEVQPTLLVAE